MRKITIGTKIIDVIDEEEYHRRSKLDDPMFEDTCIEMNGMVYPIQKRYDGSPGVCDYGPVLRYTKPIVDQEQYSSENIIDFNKAKDFAAVMKTQDAYKRCEEAILTSPDNITTPVIKETNSPLLALTKQMIIEKHIDIDLYGSKLKEDKNNALRPIKDKNNDTITINRAVNLCQCCDVRMIVRLEDKPGAVNPMGKILEMEITSGGE